MTGRVMRCAVVLGLLLGGTALNDDKAEACVRPAHGAGTCSCISAPRGSQGCGTDGEFCTYWGVCGRDGNPELPF